MLKNLPVVIRLESLIKNWDSYKNWILPNRSSLNIDYLKNKIGNLPEVPVANCNEKYFDSHSKINLSFFEYLEYWENRDKHENPELLYLKDWHLRNKLPDYIFYSIPKYFSSDFLNEYLTDIGAEDYKFVYIGPANSFTPFHADVFSSFSWSVNIFGRKRWIFISPGEENKLKDVYGNLPFTIDIEMLTKYNVKHFVIIQETGNAIFVPSNWHHQVYNELDTVSINHNWFNGANISYVYESMKNCENRCRNEIKDCLSMANFEQHCQVILKSVFGMDYRDFLTILDHIVQKRVNTIKDIKKSKVSEEISLDENHLNFDLNQIFSVLKVMSSDDEVLFKINSQDYCNKIIEKIESQLQK
uniref:Jumonji domain-containing protein 4 n=1 Tax=Culicoides sonorensis TaxID=179676 RepID=A0A336K565_CULSO